MELVKNRLASFVIYPLSAQDAVEWMDKKMNENE